MYAVTGITGRVGGGGARALLDAGLPVRAVVRDDAKGGAWKKRGCEVAFADMSDARALERRPYRHQRRICADLWPGQGPHSIAGDVQCSLKLMCSGPSCQQLQPGSWALW